MENFINVYHRYFRFKLILVSIISAVLALILLILIGTNSFSKLILLSIVVIIALIVNVLFLVMYIQVVNRLKHVDYDSVTKIELTAGHSDFMGIIRYDFKFNDRNLYTKKFFSTNIYKKITNKEMESKEFYAAYSLNSDEVLLLEKR